MHACAWCRVFIRCDAHTRFLTVRASPCSAMGMTGYLIATVQSAVVAVCAEGASDPGEGSEDRPYTSGVCPSWL